MTWKRKSEALAVLAVLLVFGAGARVASALTLDASGNVTDWGVSPFSGSGTPYQVNMAWRPSGTAPGSFGWITWWTEQNNYSPVNYPWIGQVPSPGGTGGEKFDHEALYWRKVDNPRDYDATNPFNVPSVQVMVITSMGHVHGGVGVPGVTDWGAGQGYYRIGDLFISTGAHGEGVWDYAVASTNWKGYEGEQDKLKWWAYDHWGPETGTIQQYFTFSHDDAPGTVYQIEYDGFAIDPDLSLLGSSRQVVTVVDGLKPGGELPNGVNVNHLGYGAYTSVEPDVRPWVVNPAYADGVDTGGAALKTATYNYGTAPGGGFNSGGSDVNRDENGTWIFEYTIPLSNLGLDENYNLADLQLHITNECGNDTMAAGSTVGGVPPIAEPITLLGLFLGVPGLAGYILRRRRVLRGDGCETIRPSQGPDKMI